MIKNLKIPVLALLLLGAARLHAQDVGIINPDQESESQVPTDFVQEGQIVPVAEEDIDEGDDFSVPEANDDEKLLAEFELFKQLMYDQVFDEADTVAKRVVEMAIRTKGPQSNEFAKALTNLAIVQFQTEQYLAAQQNFESAIEIIEDNEDRLNAQLVNPLKGLAAAQLESGRPDLASTTFKRAVHLTHVNEGPHNLDQVTLLESIAETFMRMGDLEAAKEAQDTIYALNIRKYELDTPELVPSLLRRAAWQHRAGFIFDERATYRRTIRIIEDHSGKDSLELVEPLILLGKSYFYLDTSGDVTFHNSSMSSGEIYFKRSARIAKEHPDTNWQVIAQATLALGDFYMYANNSQRAQQTYRAAWELLSEDESRLGVRREQLEEVIPLRQQKLPMYVSSSDEESEPKDEDPLLQGNITISYVVSARGQATTLHLIQAEPPELTKMLNHVQREVRRRLYRPRLENGEVVATPDLILSHRFFYRQSDLDAALAAAATDKK
jgi:tetratricopeptide (TPR) repeat protein